MAVMATMLIVLHSSRVECAVDAAVAEGPDSSFDFAEVDTDGNGCVEGVEEMQLFRLKVGKILGDALQLGEVERALRSGRITHSADVNNDGRICECDLLSILLTESTGPGLHSHAFRVYEDGDVFDSVDTDKDGFLADDTEKAVMTEKLAKCVPVDKAKVVLDAMGQLKENDGKVSREEYLLFLSPEAYPPAEPQPQPKFLPLLPFSSPNHASPQQAQPAGGQPQVQPSHPVGEFVPVQTQSQPQQNPPAPTSAIGQPQPFKLSPLSSINQPIDQPFNQPLGHPVNQPVSQPVKHFMGQPILSQPAAGQPFRTLPLRPFLAANPALMPFPMKYFMAQQQLGQVPVAPAAFSHPILLSQWLPQAQPLIQANQGDAGNTEDEDLARESEDQLHEVLAQERERAAAQHVLKGHGSGEHAHQSADMAQQAGDQTHQSEDRAQQAGDQTHKSGKHAHRSADEIQPVGNKEKDAMAVLDEKAPEALAELDRVAASLNSVE